MKYYCWADIRDDILYVKRITTSKWYTAIELLEQNKDFIEKSEYGLLRTQFIMDSKDILILANIFSYKISKDLREVYWVLLSSYTTWEETFQESEEDKCEVVF